MKDIKYSKRKLIFLRNKVLYSISPDPVLVSQVHGMTCGEACRGAFVPLCLPDSCPLLPSLFEKYCAVTVSFCAFELGYS